MKYFVTEQYIKLNTSITTNAQSEDVVPYVGLSADLWIQPILGTYFYEYLLDKYNDQTLNSDEEKLVRKIQPCVAWRSAAQAVVSLTLQLKNKGLQRQFSDNSEPVDDTTIQFVKGEYEGKAMAYESLLVKWLTKNKDLFPEFISEDNDNSIVKPQDDNNYGTYLTFV